MTNPQRSEVTVDLSQVQQGNEPASQAQPQDGTPPSSGAPAAVEGERLYAGKYKTVEELEAAFLAAQQPPKAPEGDTKSGLEIPETGADDGEVRDALTRAGIDMDALAEELNASGALSEESYKKLADAGYPKQLVDVYVQGLKAEQQKYESAVYAPVGGKEGYASLIQWATTNLSAEQKRAFNEAVTSGDAGRAALAVQGLVALRGGNPRLLSGKTTAGADAGPQPFRSIQEIVAAQRDPRYRRDPAYRKDVEARLRVTDIL